MEDLFVVAMSRWQFAVTVVSHFTFVSTTVGLLIAVVILELIYAFGKGKDNEQYGRLALFFGKICFFSFGSGVVTGLVMEFQFGMNWSSYAKFFGDVIGVPMALEGLVAFFLESTLFGLWRFTWGKISKKVHVLFGGLLLLTSLASIFWIILVNAFMQNPVGFHMEGGRARLNSIAELVQNPQYLPEVLHVFFGILILGGFVTAGISAWQIMKKRDVNLFKKSIQIGLLIAVPVAVMQPVMGDDQIFATSSLQSMKFAAAEAQYDDEGSDTTGTPWTVVAYIDEKNHKTHGIAIPGLGSYFGTGKFVGSSEGMETIAKAYHTKYDDTVAASYKGDMNYYPPVTLLFICLRLMVIIGYYFGIFGVMAMILLHRRRVSIEEHPKTLKLLGITMWFPYVILMSGWIVAEVGRFPFVVYGLLTHLDAVSPNMTPGRIIFSLTAFVIVDLTLIITMLIISHRTIKKGAPQIDGNYVDEANDTDFFGKEVSPSV